MWLELTAAPAHGCPFSPLTMAVRFCPSSSEPQITGLSFASPIRFNKPPGSISKCEVGGRKPIIYFCVHCSAASRWERCADSRLRRVDS